MQFVDGQLLSKERRLHASVARRISLLRSAGLEMVLQTVEDLHFILQPRKKGNAFERPPCTRRTIALVSSTCRRRIEMSFVHLPLYI